MQSHKFFSLINQVKETSNLPSVICGPTSNYKELVSLVNIIFTRIIYVLLLFSLLLCDRTHVKPSGFSPYIQCMNSLMIGTVRGTYLKIELELNQELGHWSSSGLPACYLHPKSHHVMSGARNIWEVLKTSPYC